MLAKKSLRPWHAALIIGAMAIALKAVVAWQFDGISSDLSYTFLFSLTVSATVIFLICDFIPFTRKYMDLVTDSSDRPRGTIGQRMFMASLGLPLLGWSLWRLYQGG